MPHHKQPPRAVLPIPAPIAITAMTAIVLVFVVLAVAAVLSEPSPMLIELAPQDFAANNDGDRFNHTHNHDLTAPEGMFPHLEHTFETAV